MASSTNNQFILVLFSFLLILKTSSSFGNHSSTDGILPFAPKHVVVVNKLTSQAKLIAHCTNKEKDLGVKELLPGSSFDFRFRVNLRKTTRYTCTFEWPGNKIEMILQKVNLEFVENVFGTFMNQPLVVLTAMQAFLIALIGILRPFILRILKKNLLLEIIIF
ncbi:hypothetical protein YC2023_096591 [Brassica napus]